MRFRLTLLLGLAIGYVLGAKAGRERYQQIMDMWRQFQGTEPVREVSEQVSNLADQAVDTAQSRASESVSKVSESIGGAQGSGGGTTP